MEGMGAHAQRLCQSIPDPAALGEQDLASGDLPFRAQAEPGCEGRSVSELRHVTADLTQDGMGRHCTDATPG